MATFIFVLLFAFAVAMALPDFQYDLEKAEEHFQSFIETYGKQYPNKHVHSRKFEVFKESLKRYNVQNLEQVNAKFGINEDSDLTIEEFTKSRLGYLRTDDSSCKEALVPEVTPPEVYDWQQQGSAVTPVKNQRCGDCWAFSATANIEGQYAKQYKELVDFSEQQIVDCDKSNGGCHGGDMTLAFIYLNKTGGLMTLDDYPYKGEDGKCTFNADKVKVKVSGCDLYNITNEEDLIKVLYQQGPLSVALDATSLMGYNGGILSECASNGANHGVLLVGYGVENNVKFWRFKNSWGTNYGEEGYFRLERGNDLCGILDAEIVSANIA